MANLNFSTALDLLKEGKKICREGWNGKGMWLVLNNGRQNGIGHKLRQDGHLTEILEVHSFIVIKTAENKLVPWVASQTDILADDWELVSI